MDCHGKWDGSENQAFTVRTVFLQPTGYMKGNLPHFFFLLSLITSQDSRIVGGDIFIKIRSDDCWILSFWSCMSCWGKHEERTWAKVHGIAYRRQRPVLPSHRHDTTVSGIVFHQPHEPTWDQADVGKKKPEKNSVRIHDIKKVSVLLFRINVPLYRGYLQRDINLLP